MQVVIAIILSFLIHLILFGIDSHLLMPADGPPQAGMTIGYVERTAKSFRSVEPVVQHEQINQTTQKLKKTELIKNPEQKKSVVKVAPEVEEAIVVEDLNPTNGNERQDDLQIENVTTPEEQIDAVLETELFELEEAFVEPTADEAANINPSEDNLPEGSSGIADGVGRQTEGQDISKVEVTQSALPRYDINPRPEYPLVARKRGWEGVVLLEILVLENGRVGEIEMMTSSGYRSLDTAAKKVVRRWKFMPATVLGVPVESQVQVPIRFSLQVP